MNSIREINSKRGHKMPLDGAGYAADLRSVFDLALGLLGPNGEHWIQHESTDGNENYCILGAIHQACVIMDAPHKWSAVSLVDAALQQSRWKRRGPRFVYDYRVLCFNDRKQRTFEEVRYVMLQARQLAVASA